MRKIVAVAGLAVLCSSVIPACRAAAPKDKPGTVVIVFKDGRRQTFNLADIARFEFPGSHDAASAATEPMPARGQFVGKWSVGVGSGSDETFMITLKEDGNATRSLHEMHGTWQYVNGEARITWDDGGKDAIRKAGSKFQKYAYLSGQSFTDKPDNVATAQNTTPKPI
jgi:hypothetical protein